MRKRLRGRKWNLPEPFVVDKNLSPTSDRVDYVPEKKRLVDEILNEDKHVRKEVERKMNSSAPLYNKGAYQYIGASDDLTKIGRK